MTDAELEDAALDSTGEVRNVRRVRHGQLLAGHRDGGRTERRSDLLALSHRDGSGSEGGFERTYQGSCILLQWLMKLPPDDSVELEVEWSYKGETLREF